RCVDRGFHRLFEGGTTLHEMIVQNPESTSLREYGCVVIDRAIFKAKNQTAGDPVTLCDLGHLTIGKALAIQCAQGKKAMHQAFHVAHGYLVSSQRDCLDVARQASR